MKTSGQVAYEAFSMSFGIDVVQPNGKKSSIKGPIPWEDLPYDHKKRWDLVGKAVLDNAVSP